MWMQAEQQCQPWMCLLGPCPVFSQKPDRLGQCLVISSQVLLTIPMCEHLPGGQPVCRSDLAHGPTSEHAGSLWGPCSHLRNLAPSLSALRRPACSNRPNSLRQVHDWRSMASINLLKIKRDLWLSVYLLF